MNPQQAVGHFHDLIEGFGRATFITTLDLTKGYWQVPVAPTDREKTAFTTTYGHYQFKRMPFGLQGAPATFQRRVDKLLKGLSDLCGAYLDDVVIFSHCWEDHMKHLAQVFQCIHDAGLTLKRKKCQFAMPECIYLGHTIGSGQVRPEEVKIAAMQTFEQPQTKTHVRAFLGLTGYYRKFIPNYSSVAAPLSDLTKKSQPNQVNWTIECTTAFEELKQALCSSTVLVSPDWNKQFILQTDASERGVGAVLCQLSEEEDKPVAYFSRKLLQREQKYSTIEKECLAIKLAIEAFNFYLMGRTFLIETDHRSLEWLCRFKGTNARLTRWSLLLQSYSFTVKYRTGNRNGNADGLSRLY